MAPLLAASIFALACCLPAHCSWPQQADEACGEDEACENSLLQVSQDFHSRRARKRERVLFFMPGIGCRDMGRVHNIATSVQQILSFRDQLDVECLVHSFVKRQAWEDFAPDFLRDLEGNCTLEFLPGTLFADNVKSLHPTLLEAAGYDYLYLALDDVVISGGNFRSFDLPAALDAARRFGLDIGSPRVEGAAWLPSKYDRFRYAPLKLENVTGMFVEWVEIFNDLFSMRGWRCYWELTDPVRFGNGWGVDFLLPTCRQRVADFKIGVYAHQVVTHGVGGGHAGEKCGAGPLETYVPKDWRKPVDWDWMDRHRVTTHLHDRNASLGYF